jgi:hypothetical protein
MAAGRVLYCDTDVLYVMTIVGFLQIARLASTHLPVFPISRIWRRRHKDRIGGGQRQSPA